MTDRKATLSVGDKSIELPVYSGTVGPDVIDVRGLVQEGVLTYDPGFVATAAGESAITYIDGANSVLLHRGCRRDQLAEHSDLLEVCYLLLNDEQPSEEENKQFHETIKNHTMLHDQMRNFFNGFRRDAHPMAIMCGVVGALSAFYHDQMDVSDPKQREITGHRLIAKMPTNAARS